MSPLPRDALLAIQRFLPFEEVRRLRDVNSDFYSLFAHRCAKLVVKSTKEKGGSKSSSICNTTSGPAPMVIPLPSPWDYFEKAFDKYLTECEKIELARDPQHLKSNYPNFYFGKRSEWFKLQVAVRDSYINKMRHEEQVHYDATVFLYGDWDDRCNEGLL